MKDNRQFELPFGICITVDDGVANIESNLPEQLAMKSNAVELGRVVGVVEGIEQLLLSLARAGVDLSGPAFAEAIRDCVEKLQ